MKTKHEQGNAAPDVSAGRDASRGSQHAGGLREAASAGAKLVADLSGFFTRRRHGRVGLYLPLVRVDNADSRLS